MKISLRLIVSLLVILCYLGCKTTKVVEVTRIERDTISTRDTLIIQTEKTDTTREYYWRSDSMAVDFKIGQINPETGYRAPDTLLVEKWHWEIQNQQHKQGSTNNKQGVKYKDRIVYRDRTITKTEYKEKKLAWWQQTLQAIGAIALTILSLQLFKYFKGTRS